MRELRVLAFKDLNRSAFSVRNVVLRARASKARQAKGVVPYAVCLVPCMRARASKELVKRDKLKVLALCLVPCAVCGRELVKRDKLKVLRLMPYALCLACPHTAIYVSSYYCMCVLILLYMCPHTTIYVTEHTTHFTAHSCRTTIYSYYYMYTVYTHTSTYILYTHTPAYSDISALPIALWAYSIRHTA